MGVVKNFTAEKGFGFIIPDGAQEAFRGSQDVFFHQNEIHSPDGVLLPGQRVAYSSKLDHGRMQAAQVRPALPGEVAAAPQPVDPDAPSIHDLVNQQIAWHLKKS